ncbi:MAG: hypothetical protein SVY53_04760 [Chloroflexota bacterium]|nr:hypothetical protein [Chloroflexota bacterium]
MSKNRHRVPSTNKQRKTKRNHQPIHRPISSTVSGRSFAAAPDISVSYEDTVAMQSYRYAHVPSDLKKIGIIATVLLVALIVLAIVL